MFLSPDEILTLTGYRRHADQRRWLTVRGWSFERAASGRPIVLRSFAESALGGQPVPKSEPLPNFAAIRKAA